MVRATPPISDWTNLVAEIVGAALSSSNIIARPALDAAIAVAVIEITGCLASGSAAGKGNGRNSSNHVGAAPIARAVINGLFEAGLINRQDSDSAMEIAVEALRTLPKIADHPAD